MSGLFVASLPCFMLLADPSLALMRSMTRNWSLNRKLLDSLNLMLIDEVHTLREKARGENASAATKATLVSLDSAPSRAGPRFEIVVSRMHAFGNNVRFIAVSATVPNVVDIAEWLGQRRPLGKAGEVTADLTLSQPRQRARVFEFGDEFRPCPLTKHVCGYAGPTDQWQFQTTLNGKLLGVVAEHSSDRPTLVFVPTRKATTQAAQALQQGYKKVVDDGLSTNRPWTVPENAATDVYNDTKLCELSNFGIAFHHAGMDLEDRRKVEERFVKGNIRVLCCTSTLAVGVNLPAYCVIIRGTKRYEGQWAEISDLDLLQMLGRAGRPQFDSSGVAIIMTETSKKEHYESMVAGCTTIESRLHEELVEHINSEIGLRPDCTISDLERWLSSTFLAVRSRLNPSFYGSPEEGYGSLSTEDRLRKICADALQRLGTHGLISRGHQGLLNSTEYGETLSTYMLSLRTMLELLKIDRASVKDLITVLSQATEFADIRLRAGEKAAFAKLRTHNEIRFPPEKVNGVPEKISLLLQSVLAGLPLRGLLKVDDIPINPLGDTMMIFRHASRIVKAMTDIALHRQDAVSARSAFELLRSVNGRAWDASSATLTQLDGIGDKGVKVLSQARIYTYQQIATADPFRLEMLLKRNPPFGLKLVEEASSLPHLHVELTPAAAHVLAQPKRRTARKGNGSIADADHTEAAVDIKITLQNPSKATGGPNVATKSKGGHALHCTILTISHDAEHLFDFRRLPMRFLAKQKSAAFTLNCKMTRAGQKIVVLAAVDQIAGSAVRQELDPRIPSHFFAEDAQMQHSNSALVLEDEWRQLHDCENLFDDPGVESEIEVIEQQDLANRADVNRIRGNGGRRASGRPGSSSAPRKKPRTDQRTNGQDEASKGKGKASAPRNQGRLTAGKRKRGEPASDDSSPEESFVRSSGDQSNAYVLDADNIDLAAQHLPSASQSGDRRLNGKRQQAENDALLERLESLASRAKERVAPGAEDIRAQRDGDDVAFDEEVPRTSPATELRRGSPRLLLPSKRQVEERDQVRPAGPALHSSKYAASFEVPLTQTRNDRTSSQSSSSSLSSLVLNNVENGRKADEDQDLADKHPNADVPSSTSSLHLQEHCDIALGAPSSLDTVGRNLRDYIREEEQAREQEMWDAVDWGDLNNGFVMEDQCDQARAEVAIVPRSDGDPTLHDADGHQAVLGAGAGAGTTTLDASVDEGASPASASLCIDGLPSSGVCDSVASLHPLDGIDPDFFDMDPATAQDLLDTAQEWMPDASTRAESAVAARPAALIPGEGM